MLDDDRKAAYQIMRVIADSQGVHRIRMFNREGRLVLSTDAREQPSATGMSNEVCASCHSQEPMRNRPTEDARVRYSPSPQGFKTISMVTPIYNEASCIRSCHAHGASTKLLGVLDVAWRLDPVEKQTATKRAFHFCRSSDQTHSEAVMIIADEVEAQLTQTMDHYMNALRRAAAA
jgi:two-component system NtrC family sensor kinase